MTSYTELELLLRNDWGKIDESVRLTRLLVPGLAEPFPVTNSEAGGGLG